MRGELSVVICEVVCDVFKVVCEYVFLFLYNILIGAYVVDDVTARFVML